MTVLAGAPVMVGVDGSAGGLAAVTLAARLAASRGRALQVIHAFMWPLMHVPLGPSPIGPPEGGLRADAERIVSDAVTLAGKVQPGLPVTGRIVTGEPAAAVLQQAHHAVMVVLGNRGLGGFTGLLLGSVAVTVTAHAPCPVVVARGELDRHHDVLVGVDGSRASADAIGFAFEEASRRGVGLNALHAYSHPISENATRMVPGILDEQLVKIEETTRAEESRVLTEAIGGWCDKYPDVSVRRTLVHGRPAQTLVEASDRACLAVVGSRGHGGFAGLLLGSVSQAMLHHASCPVAVVPAG
ncbi:MAG: universal stress protein [Micromonosporaceae bacterium]